MSDQPKFCRDCRYCVVPTPGAYDLAKCHHPQALKPNTEYLVSGKQQEPDSFYASSMRGGSCGAEAKLWERKA